MRPAASLVLLAALAVACTAAPQASPSPPEATSPSASPATTAEPASAPPASPSVSPSAPPTLTPPTSAIPSPMATPSAAPSAGTGLGIEWRQGAANFGPDVKIRGSAVIDGRIVVIGARFLDDETGHITAIWWEDGDLVWRLAALPPFDPYEDSLTGIVAGGPGLIAVGSRGLLWVSADGRSWESIAGAGLPPDATIRVASDGLIALGWDDGEFSGALISTDGRHWRRSTDETTQRVAHGADLLAGSGDQLTAFVYEGARVTVWRASAAESWTSIGELPGSRGAWIVAAAVGPQGWIALGDARGPLAWTSRDGLNWELAENAPPAHRTAAFGVAAGFVVVRAHDPVGGCVIEPGNMRTETWTSSTGHIWRLVDEIADGATIVSLRRRGQTLIGIGLIGEKQGAVWTARLPDASSDAGPAPTLVPLVDSRGGC
jgi:hypothetical protein